MARISKQQLIKLQAKYKTDDAIGALFGITRQAVHQLRNKYGIVPVADKHEDRNDEISKAYKTGMPGTKLAKKFKISVSQAYRIIRGDKPRSGNVKRKKSKSR
jgi:DNA invertase Pin-like site-specific DNA recombinase